MGHLRNIAAALLVAACAAQGPVREPPAPRATEPTADLAGNRIYRLVADGERYCTAEADWCLDANVIAYSADASIRAIPIDSPESERGVWPFVVFVGPGREHALFGITTTRREMYSGGGASIVALTLYEVVAHSTAIQSVLAVTLEGSALVRACFSEADIRNRREACHDEYSFLAALHLDPSTSNGRPRFVYLAESATYPGPLSITEDSSQAPPLRRSDLVWARNEACSFRRTLVLDEEAAHYIPTEAMPECPGFIR